MPDRDHHPMSPIPGAPADSLMGLGGQDGFVGQCERELCMSMPPPPPTPEPNESVTRSYPPIPIPSLPEMPLRARMLRPWMGVAASAVLIALVGLLSGDDEAAGVQAGASSTAHETAPSTATDTDATQGHADEGDSETPETRSFGAELSKVVRTALDAGRAEAARRHAEERARADEAQGDDEARPVASTTSTSSKTKAKGKRAFNRDAARSALFSAASRASGCRIQHGPEGRGRATVTIGPSGNVMSINVSPPFAGTKTGHCVASMFRNVRVAPFSGSAVTLAKSFTIR